MIALLLSLFFASHAHAGPNLNTTLVLHAVETGAGPCAIGDPCVSGLSTTVSSGADVAVYLIARNYSDLVGLQTAFDWDDWTLLFGIWDCQSNQVNAHEPDGAGATAGTLTTSFDVISGGESGVIGRMQMMPNAGALWQVDSSYPDGTFVLGSTLEVDPVARGDRGLVRVGVPGIDVCDGFCGPEPPAACDGTIFSAVDIHYVGTFGWALDVGDVNSDGYPDVVKAVDGHVAVLPGTGGGAFGQPVFTAVGPAMAARSLALGRLDGDAHMDLALATSGSVDVRLGNGDGTFGTATSHPAGSWPVDLHLHDLDGDGILDAAVVDQSSDAVIVLLGNGDGTFGAGTHYITAEGKPRGLDIGDVNGDQVSDIAVTGYDSYWGQVEILEGVGDGNFQLGSWSSSVLSPLGGIALGDLNGDQRLDLAVAGGEIYFWDGRVSIYLGDGDGGFVWHHDESSDVCQRELAIAPLDDDLHNDLVILVGGNCTSHATCISGDVSVRRGLGDGSFTQGSDCLLSEEGARGLFVGDATGDLTTDLVVGLYGRLAVLHGTSLVSVQPSPTPPSVFALGSAPNPFRNETVIKLNVPPGGGGPASLEIYDTQGRWVRTLIDRRVLTAGEHRIVWDGRDHRGRRVATGTYFERLRVGDREMRRKLHVYR